jgi:hypothetical protein
VRISAEEGRLTFVVQDEPNMTDHRALGRVSARLSASTRTVIALALPDAPLEGRALHSAQPFRIDHQAVAEGWILGRTLAFNAHAAKATR